jgi:hypothetical protein
MVTKSTFQLEQLSGSCFSEISLALCCSFPWVCDSVMEVQNVTDSILLVRLYFVKFSVVFWPKRYNHRSAMAS